MNTFILGTANDPNIDRLTKYYNFSASHSFNGIVTSGKYFYNLYSPNLGIKIFIYKDSEDGENFKNWLSSHNNIITDDDAHIKILELVLPLVTSEEFHLFIKRIFEIYYDNGYKDAQCIIRKAIGIK